MSATAFDFRGHLMSKHAVIANPATIQLSPSQIPAEWILEGCPQARATAIAHSHDGAMTVIAWSCTKGRFRWHYQIDEMCHILSGEVFITDQSGIERRLGAGETVLFPAGSSSVWQVTQDVRKVAVCHVAVPKALGLALRIWNKLCRIGSAALGLDAESAPSGGGLMSAAQHPSTAAAPPG
jgi:uncharacterized cupin superfamily protein